MNFDSKAFLLFGMYVVFTLFSCGNNAKNSKNDIWANTSWTNLDGESIAFRKPNILKKSSRFRLQKDMVSIANDSVKLTLLQNTLANQEFQDSEVDVFIDTTTTFGLVVMCNMPASGFNKELISSIKTSLNKKFDAQEARNLIIEYSDVKATTKQNQNHALAKFTTTLTNILDESQVRQNLFYLFGNSYTLMVYEFTDSENSIEKYLWTTKIR